MNPEIKQKWLEALRSDKFKQTQGVLMNANGYCCLGVLCAIQGADENELIDKTTSSVDPKYAAGLEEVLQDKLADLNDGGMKFEQIAQVIEELA